VKVIVSERVHVGPRTGFLHDGSSATDMIKVTVRENQVLEPVWRKAKPANRVEDGYLFFRKTGVNQRQSLVVLDQVGVCHPHRDDMHAIDHTLHAHCRNSSQRNLPHRTRSSSPQKLRLHAWLRRFHLSRAKLMSPIAAKASKI
jgi:hypothetical protein